MTEEPRASGPLRMSGIEVTAHRSKEVHWETQHFDVGIFFSSFESRVLAWTDSPGDLSFGQTFVVQFTENQESDLRREHDAALVATCERLTVSGDVSIVGGLTLRDPNGVVSAILDRLPLSTCGAEKRWLIDLTGAPTPCWAGLLAALRTGMFSPRLTLFNATAPYFAGTATEYCFTSGFEKYIWVPGCWGRPDNMKEWLYVFLLGLEGHRAYEVYKNCEPAKIAAVIGDPGYTNQCSGRAIQANRRILEEGGLLSAGEVDVGRADAADVVEAIECLRDMTAPWSDRYNICYVPLGPKAHSLAGVLICLCGGDQSMLYHMPTAFPSRDLPRGKYVWRYELRL